MNIAIPMDLCCLYWEYLQKCNSKRLEVCTLYTPVDCKKYHYCTWEENTFTDRNPMDSETETCLHNGAHESKTANENEDFSAKIDCSYVVSADLIRCC